MKHKEKETFECDLGSLRTTTGTYPFLRDVWHGVLKEHTLGPKFKPGDTVRVTIERIKT